MGPADVNNRCRRSCPGFSGKSSGLGVCFWPIIVIGCLRSFKVVLILTHSSRTRLMQIQASFSRQFLKIISVSFGDVGVVEDNFL